MLQYQLKNIEIVPQKESLQMVFCLWLVRLIQLQQTNVEQKEKKKKRNKEKAIPIGNIKWR